MPTPHGLAFLYLRFELWIPMYPQDGTNLSHCAINNNSGPGIDSPTSRQNPGFRGLTVLVPLPTDDWQSRAERVTAGGRSQAGLNPTWLASVSIQSSRSADAASIRVVIQVNITRQWQVPLIIDFLLTDHIDRNWRLDWNVRCENLEPIGPNMKKLSPKNRASRGLKSIVVLERWWQARIQGGGGGRWVRHPPLGRRDPLRRRGFLHLKGRKNGHWCPLNGCSTPSKHNMAINILKSCKSVLAYVKNRSSPSHIRSSIPWRPPLAEILDPRLGGTECGDRRYTSLAISVVTLRIIYNGRMKCVVD